MQHFFGARVAGLGLFFHGGEEIKNEQGGFQRIGGGLADGGVAIVEQGDERLHVVAAQHGAEQLGGAYAADEGHAFLALRHSREEGGFDFRRVVHAGGHAVREQLQQFGVFGAVSAAGGRFDEVGELRGLLRRQRQRRDAEGGAFGGVGAVGVHHGVFLRYI